MSSSVRTDSMPQGIWNAYIFQAFNAASFTLVNGPLMVLYFKKLGATATILGILASLPPLLITLQIPAAHFVEKVGYRAFVLRGWSIRSLFVILMAGVVFLPETISPQARIVLLLFLLAAYNASRGISGCGFLPWISKLVPESVMGRYLALDQAFLGAALVLANLAVALFFLNAAGNWTFGVVLLGSFILALFSLAFLRRIPDVPISREEGKMPRMGWREIVFHPNFFKFLVYNFIVHLGYGASGGFWAPFVKDTFTASDSTVLGLVAGSTLANVAGVLFFGRIIDRVGSRPMLALAGFVFVLHFMIWFSIGCGLLPFNLFWIVIQCLGAGWASSMFNLANMRLVMGIVPERGRSHFFAWFSVLANVVLGVSPVLWGLILESLRGWEYTLDDGMVLHRYSIMYLFISLTSLIGMLSLRSIKEERAMTTEAFLHELFIATPSRAFAQLFRRAWWNP
jgi:MFS family permease